MEQSTEQSPAKAKKLSLYQRYQLAKHGKPMSDEDLRKYTGMDRAELNKRTEAQQSGSGNVQTQTVGSAATGATGSVF